MRCIVKCILQPSVCPTLPAVIVVLFSRLSLLFVVVSCTLTFTFRIGTHLSPVSHPSACESLPYSIRTPYASHPGVHSAVFVTVPVPPPPPPPPHYYSRSSRSCTAVFAAAVVLLFVCVLLRVLCAQRVVNLRSARAALLSLTATELRTTLHHHWNVTYLLSLITFAACKSTTA